MMKKPIIFNLTIKLSKLISEDWLRKMEGDYLPPCTDGQIIISSQINRILFGDDSDDDVTFAVQFTYADAITFKEYKLETMKKFLDLLDKEFKGKYVYFTTVMEKLYCNSSLKK